jgi:polar amino acid transport system substrate-binding protein
VAMRFGLRLMNFRCLLGARVRAVALGVAVAVAALGCASGGSFGSGTSSSVLSNIVKSGQIRVGMSGNQPPLNLTSRAGELIGMEVDLAKMIAGAMGVEAQMVAMPFADLLPALESGQLDMVISGMTITAQRNLRVAFVGPYFVSGKSILTRSQTLLSSDEPADLDQSDLSLAALRGSTSEMMVEKLIPRAKLVATTDYDEAVKMVIGEQVDALVADFPICVLSVLRYPDKGLATLVTPFTIEPLGIALPANEPLFLNLVQNHLDALAITGILGSVRSKWFEDGSWVRELP